MLTGLVQDIYLVQTKADQKKVPGGWIKSGGTKVGFRCIDDPNLHGLTAWTGYLEMEG